MRLTLLSGGPIEWWDPMALLALLVPRGVRKSACRIYWLQLGLSTEERAYTVDASTCRARDL